MNDLIDHFCESKHRWLIVTSVTVVLVLLTVVPLVDQYNTLCSEYDELSGQLTEVQRLTADLPVFEKRVGAKLEELNALDQQTVNQEAVSNYRNKLLEFARESGCRVRRISFGSARSRPWHEEDDVMSTSVPKQAGSKPTPYAVETRPVTISVDGSTSSIKKLITTVQNDSTMQHVKFLELRPAGSRQEQVQMDLELWCYALERPSA